MTTQALNRPVDVRCAPVPTNAQRKALHADHAKRYARQYRDVQDAVTDFQVARLRYEAERLSRQPEPCQFCAVDDESPALLGLVDVLSAEFGVLWPVWAFLYLAFVAAGLCGLVAIIWSVSL